MELIKFDDNKSSGHYSPAVVHNNIIYVSGQLPLRQGSKEPISNRIDDQTLLVLEKLKTILEKAKSGIENVLRVTIYIPNVELWDKVNEIYADFFGEYKPARTVVPTNNLHYNCLIELDAIAFVK